MYVYSFIPGGRKKSKETQVTVELKGKKPTYPINGKRCRSYSSFKLLMLLNDLFI